MAGSNAKVTRLLLLATVIILTACARRAVPVPYHLSQDDKALLRPGDIIMRRGEGTLSDMIVAALDDTLGVSHCGIVVCRGDSLAVIHCLSREVSDADGVQICSLDKFTSESVPGSIIAVRCTSDTLLYMASSAEYYLRTGRPFDKKFDVADSSAFFCSELPLIILKEKLNINLCKSDRKIPFSVFFNPKYFKIVLNHPK